MKTRRGKFLAKCLLLLFLLLIIIGIGISSFDRKAKADDPLCGSTITENLTLDHDIACTGHGLVVGANGITIDGGNHTITGDGGSGDYGININSHNNITIQNFGTTTNSGISNFNTGIYIDNSTGSVIQNNIVNSNYLTGISLYSSGSSTLTGNTTNSNAIGIYLNDSGSSTLTRNTANLNGTVGIWLLLSSTPNTLEDNTVNSNGIGIKFSSSTSNTLTRNTILMNRDGFNDDQAASNTYQNNQFLHNTTGALLSFVETSTPGIKKVNDTISFTITVKKPSGVACINCTTIATAPSESSLSYSDNGSGVVTGSFVPTRTGTYSLDIKVTDSDGNFVKRNYSFLVGTTSTQTTTYYYRGLMPTHGQPHRTDSKSLLLAIPASTEEWTCQNWIQNSPDVLPDYPLAYLSSIDSYTWYKQSAEADAYIGAQRYVIYSWTVDDNASSPVDAAAKYTWVNKKFTNLNWTMDYSWNWYRPSLKLNGSNVYWTTFPAAEADADPVSWAAHHHPDGTTDPSYADLTYQYTTTPTIKSIANTDILVLSATEPSDDEDNATIVVDAVSGTKSGDIVLRDYERPFLGYATTISSDGTTTIAANNIAGETTINSAKMDITPSEGTIDVIIDAWNTSGTYYRKWTETGSTSGIIAEHTIGDLKNDVDYKVKVDGTMLGSYRSNSSGQIAFTYSGGYSTKTFEVQPADLVLPVTGPDIETVYAVDLWPIILLSLDKYISIWAKEWQQILTGDRILVLPP